MTTLIRLIPLLFFYPWYRQRDSGMLYSTQSEYFQSFLRDAAQYEARMQRRKLAGPWTRERMTLNYHLFT